jgi:hypothetical protein
VDVDAGLDQVGGHLVRARAGVLVHELARVGDEPDVERLGDRLRRAHAQARHQVPDHLGGAGRLRHDVVDRAEQRVVVVVVDVEDVRALALERVGRVAVDVAAVEEHDRALREIGRRLGDEVLDLQERVLVGQRELVGGHVGDRVLAERGQHELHPRERAERVAVGVLVGREQEALRALDRVEQLGA